MNKPADPYESYLQRAEQLFGAGEVVQAGQIWQAILKRVPGHERAQAGLYRVKLHFDARATQDGLKEATPTENPRDTAASLPQTASKAPLTPPSPSDLARSLNRGCALYDAGQLEDALRIWEEVLEQDPGNSLAGGYIQQARRILAQNPPPAADPAPQPAAPAPTEPPETEKLLRDGCTLYDMGEVEGALAKWEQALALEPDHALARQYADGARRELGRPLGEEPSRPAEAGTPAVPPSALDEEDDPLARMVKEGVQLYDMGMTEEALERWRRVLATDPQHTEAQGYVEMALRESHMESPTAARPTPAPAPTVDPMVPLFAEARELLQRQRFAEAAEAFQRILQHRPDDVQALHGYQQARTLAAAQSLPTQPEPPPTQEAVQAPASVTPPAAIEQVPPPPRKGLSMQGLLRKGVLPPWALSPKVLITTVGVFFALIIGSYIVHSVRQDRALAAAVASRRGQVLAPVKRSTEIPDLAESPAAIRKEAEGALGEDSLLAYFRAQELVRLNPSDASAGQLLERARGGLSSTVSGSYSLPDFEKLVQIGDLDGADKLMDGLLRMDPDNPTLRERAGRVWLAKAQVFAAKGRWSDARDALHRGRAAFPQDKTWRARLRLLEQIQGMSKPEQASWIQLLG